MAQLIIRGIGVCMIVDWGCSYNSSCSKQLVNWPKNDLQLHQLAVSCWQALNPTAAKYLIRLSKFFYICQCHYASRWLLVCYWYNFRPLNFFLSNAVDSRCFGLQVAVLLQCTSLLWQLASSWNYSNIWSHTTKIRFPDHASPATWQISCRER